jgi:hypothetical protein
MVHRISTVLHCVNLSILWKTKNLKTCFASCMGISNPLKNASGRDRGSNKTMGGWIYLTGKILGSNGACLCHKSCLLDTFLNNSVNFNKLTPHRSKAATTAPCYDQMLKNSDWEFHIPFRSQILLRVLDNTVTCQTCARHW